jgi:hypothetical protein
MAMDNGLSGVLRILRTHESELRRMATAAQIDNLPHEGVTQLREAL